MNPYIPRMLDTVRVNLGLDHTDKPHYATGKIIFITPTSLKVSVRYTNNPREVAHTLTVPYSAVSLVERYERSE
jgi:hypothetical protein